MAVHHFNVPVALDVSDRFMVLHYTDWESLNGRNINNWVRAEATPCSLRYDWAAGWILYGRMLLHTLESSHWMDTLDKLNSDGYWTHTGHILPIKSEF